MKIFHFHFTNFIDYQSAVNDWRFIICKIRTLAFTYIYQIIGWEQCSWNSRFNYNLRKIRNEGLFSDSKIIKHLHLSEVPVFACLWHQAIAGRKKEEIISCYHAFLLKNRDAKEITLWCDNCGVQNKSWALFSFLVYIINSTEISADRINIKYLQKGHVSR